MKPFDILLYALVVVGWSTSWLPLKWQVGEIAPEVSLVWRFIIAGSLLMIITRLSGRRLALPLWGHGVALVIGLFLFSTNYFFFYTGALVLPSGLLAVVFASASLINLFFSAAVFRTPITPLGLVASALGFGGILLLYWPEIAGQGSGPSGEGSTLAVSALAALGLCFLGTLSFCSGNMVSAAAQRRDLPVMGSTAWAMLYGASLMLALSLNRGQELAIEVSWQYIGGGLWLAVFGSVLAFTAYLTLLGRIGASRAAYATVLFPPIALGISTVVEGYQWTWSALIGLPLVLVGIVLINQTRRPAATPPLPPEESSPPSSPSSHSPPPEGSNPQKAKTP